MTKKHFIALADTIRDYNGRGNFQPFTEYQIQCLANFCRDTNPRFNRQHWLDYIAGKCGPNGDAR